MKRKSRSAKESKNQIARQSGVDWGHVTEGIFYLLSKQGQKQDEKLEVHIWLVRILAWLFFAVLPCFCLVLEALVLGLIVDFAISGAEFIGGEVAISFSKWLL